MFLRPQHFQQQARYIERIIHQRVEGVRAFGWGVIECTLDRAALAIGKFAISSAVGVLDDGTPFAIPHDTDAPPPIDVPETTRNQRVLLTLPLRRAGMPDTVLRERDDVVAARYAARDYDAPDAIVGSDLVGTVQIGRPRLRFVVETPQSDLGGFALLPLCKIVEVRGGDRQVIIDDQFTGDRSPFIPPCLSISTTALASFATELQGMLAHRGEALAQRATQPGMRGQGELVNLLTLQLVNRYTPVMAHYAQRPMVHPRDFHELLLEIAGELATYYAPNRRPPDFPPYQHDDLQATFTPVIIAIRRFLLSMIRVNALQIPLEVRKFGMRLGALTPEAKGLLRTATFVLAARGPYPPDALRRRFPTSAKLGSAERIASLVGVAVPGISLHPMPVAPAQLPFVAQTTYFELDKSSERFRELANSSGIAIHVPAEDWPKEVELELWAIRPEG
jgi:type VI secretion system protein ImpJ